METQRQKLKELFQEDGKLLILTMKEINSLDGSFDFTCTYDLQDICEITSSTYDIARAIVFGNVTNIEDDVRYNGYGNLENVNEFELLQECEDSMDECIEWILEYGNTLTNDTISEIINI